MQRRQWNPKSFFRSLSRDAAEMLSKKYSVTLFDNAEGENKLSTFELWKKLPAQLQQAIMVDLLPVNDLCTTHARPYLDDLARLTWSDSEALIESSRDWTAQDLAVRLSIASPDAFKHVHQEYAIEMMDHLTEYRARWRAEITASAEAKRRIKEAMVSHFRTQAGGTNCAVEDFEGADKFALSVYHESEMVPVDVFDEAGKLVSKPQRPVARIVAIFYPDIGTLMVKSPQKQDREKLRDLFAEVFVGRTDFFEDNSVNPKFDFSPLRSSETSFATKASDHIEEVSLVKLVVGNPKTNLKRLTFDFSPGLTMEGVSRAATECGIEFESCRIYAAQLLFKFEGKGRGRNRTVSLTSTSRSNLLDTPRDRLIRRCLKEWKIDAPRLALAPDAPPSKAA